MYICPYILDGHSMASASQHINPSIAPSIGEVSLAMTNSLLSASASHLERSGITTAINMDDNDRDSSSRQVCERNGKYLCTCM